MNLVMPRFKPVPADSGPIARTIRFPQRLRALLAEDAVRCGRSFEAQVVAILRRHFGEDVDLAPAPETVLSMAIGSLAGIPASDRDRITRRMTERNR